MSDSRYAPDSQAEIKLPVRRRSWLSGRLDALLSSRPMAAKVGLILAFAGPFFPLLGLPALLLALLFLISVASARERLPIHLPRSAARLDPNNVHPATGKPNRANGIWYLGTERATKAQLWVNKDQLLRHFLFFGSTGSGKTEALYGLVFNALTTGSGFIYVDAKGTIQLLWELYGMACMTGDEDSFMFLNYMTGGRRVGEGPIKYSNSVNPFAIGSSAALTELLTSMLAEGGKDDNAPFKNKAIQLIRAVLAVLCELRDQNLIKLSMHTLRHYIDSLARLAALGGVYSNQDESGAWKYTIPDAAGVLSREEIEADDLSRHLKPETRRSIQSYIFSIPGYDPGKPIREQVAQERSEVARQYGFNQFYWTPIFADFIDAYPHIYAGHIGEIEYRDVINNRRSMVVILPPMEKSSASVKTLGRINLSALKLAFSIGLGGAPEGSRHEVLETGPASAEVPFPVILDEYAYQATEDFGIVPAQVRGLGFTLIFAGQGWAAFKVVGEIPAMQIVENTNLKIAFKIEDAKETFELFRGLAGQTHVEQYQNWKPDEEIGERTIGAHDVARLDIRDLKSQQPGQGVMLWNEKIIYFNAFYTAAKRPAIVSPNRLLGMQLPLPEEIPIIRRLSKIAEGRADERMLAPGRWPMVMAGVKGRLLDDLSEPALSQNIERKSQAPAGAARTGETGQLPHAQIIQAPAIDLGPETRAPAPGVAPEDLDKVVLENIVQEICEASGGTSSPDESPMDSPVSESPLDWPEMADSPVSGVDSPDVSPGEVEDPAPEVGAEANPPGPIEDLDRERFQALYAEIERAISGDQPLRGLT